MMTNRNPRDLAADVLVRWSKREGTIDQLRDKVFAEAGEWDDRDRSLFTEITYGVVRNIRSLDAELAKLLKAGVAATDPYLLAILRAGIYQIRYLDRVPAHAVVSEAVTYAKKVKGDRAGGLVNAVLRRALREGVPSELKSGGETGSDAYAEWRVKWEGQWGKDKTDSLVLFYSTVPPLGLRRNLLRTESDEQWFEMLKAEGVKADPLEAWPGYAYTRGIRPDSLPSFKSGLTTVQDPGAGVPVAMLDPQPSERILDLCGAPGGKAALIWEKMGGQGELISIDRNEKRTARTREGLDRMGHTAVQVMTADILELEIEPGDRVLIDVPCSGTGVAHRRADLAARRGPEEVHALSSLQANLLEAAAKLVKSGGILVYSTCSLEPEENSRRARAFDSSFEEQYVRGEVPATVHEKWVTGPGEALVWPPRDRMDGSYSVRWRRVT